jgi:hypothetical protein
MAAHSRWSSACRDYDLDPSAANEARMNAARRYLDACWEDEDA